MSHTLRTFAILVFITLSTSLKAQNSGVISGQDTSRRVITTAVPFLTIAPDPIAGAMGDVGAATDPNANAAHWNPAKLTFINKSAGIAASFTPWLQRFVDDMSISYLSGFKKIDDVSAFGFAMTYFDLGDIQLTDGAGNELNTINPREFALAGTYSRKLGNDFSIGVTGKFIHSNLSGGITVSPVTDPKPGTSIAADIGVYYRSRVTVLQKDSQLSFGGVISNLGAKISYNSADEEDFIPTNLRLGSALSTYLDPYNKITLAMDFNKLMVPTPQPDGSHLDKGLLEGVFGSFGDAPDGIGEELQEVTISTGAEYEYKETFAIRAGYFYEHVNKGNRKFFTMGVGFKHKNIGVDFAYLIPQFQDHPLAETLRFGLTLDLGKKDGE
ncbi:MAG: type IX secretion system outer membrane channel protein PorV [Roseivirga sp.]